MEVKQSKQVEAEFNEAEKTDFKILCPFCSEPYDAKMLTDFDYSMGTEQTGIYNVEVGVQIYCSNCKRLIYKK